ncbi:MAG: SLBB domain-containing protein [Capsulimonadaceae bacterium]|nr:SLBB domain-containing protein [Capsulimonadaceae bacterium]
MNRMQGMRISFSLPLCALLLAAAPALQPISAWAGAVSLASPNVVMPIVAEQPATYVIHDGDSIDFSVLGHDELKATVTVLPDGTASFPGAGVVQTAGLSASDLTSLLEKKVGTTINGPTVTVIVHPVIDFAKASVIGAVKTPGQYAISSDMRLIDVVASAGGLAQGPELTSILVVHPGGTSSQRIEGATLMSNSDPSQNIPIKPGDVIIVQAQDERWLVIQMAGEVAHPGAYSVPKEGVLLPAALAMAGGVLPTGSMKNAQILHNGQVRTVDIDRIRQNLNDDAAKERLMPGDVLQVPANENRVAILGEVHNPAAYSLSEKGDTTVSQAILLAGGTTDTADTGKVNLIRQDNTGKLVSISVSMDDIMSGKTRDYKLARGDVVYVPAKHKSDFNLVNWVGLGGIVSLITLLK